MTMSPIPRDFSEEMVSQLLMTLADAPEGLVYEIIQPVGEHETLEELG